MQNKKIYIEFILDCFGKGIVERGEVMAKFGKVWQTPPRTFDRYFQKAKEQHSQQRELINNAKLNTTIEEEKEAVKIGLKSKFERLLILQNEVDNCTKDLENGFTEELKSDGQLLSRPITIQEKTALRNTIKNLQSEISKIEGDYAPSKSETDITIDNFSLKDVISFDKS
jgi:hypothetical protein